jgi:hypothetical protein
MVQVDMCFAYGIGGSLAAAAGRQLRNETQPHRSKFYIRTFEFLVLIWTPPALFLLLQNPSWETMQVATGLSSLPAWLVVAFVIVHITQGLLGFWVTTHLIRRGRYSLAHLNWILGYSAMFFMLLYGWDGLGYDRFLYDRALFGGRPWVPGAGLGSALDFFSHSSIPVTLDVIGALIFPPLLFYFATWAREGAVPGVKAPGTLQLILLYLFGAVLGVGLGTAAICALAVHYIGQALGAGSHAARFHGTGGSTPMHVLSYFIGLPLGIAAVHLALLRRGRPLHRLLLLLPGAA